MTRYRSIYEPPLPRKLSEIRKESILTGSKDKKLRKKAVKTAKHERKYWREKERAEQRESRYHFLNKKSLLREIKRAAKAAKSSNYKYAHSAQVALNRLKEHYEKHYGKLPVEKKQEPWWKFW